MNKSPLPPFSKGEFSTQRILGIDPGSRKLGFGLLELSNPGRRLICLDHRVIRLNVDLSLPERMRELAERLSELLATHKPNIAALEDIFVSENARSALILGQARGAVLACLGLAQIPVTTWSSTHVKQSITGNGRASKQQVGEMVKHLLKLDAKPPEDAADALALAICQAHSGHASPLKVPKRQSSRLALAELAQKQGKLG